MRLWTVVLVVSFSTYSLTKDCQGGTISSNTLNLLKDCDRITGNLVIKEIDVQPEEHQLKELEGSLIIIRIELEQLTFLKNLQQITTGKEAAIQLKGSRKLKSLGLNASLDIRGFYENQALFKIDDDSFLTNAQYSELESLVKSAHGTPDDCEHLFEIVKKKANNLVFYIILAAITGLLIAGLIFVHFYFQLHKPAVLRRNKKKSAEAKIVPKEPTPEPKTRTPASGPGKA